MMNTEILQPSDIERAAELLRKGKLVAFPTETVYGLGARADRERAVEEIFTVKGRPSDNPLILHVADLKMAKKCVQELPAIALKLIEDFWPGPLTLVLPKADWIPSQVTASLSTIAIRQPAHPLAQELIKLTKHPLVAPSANLSGKPSSTKLEHVYNDFQGKIPAILDGGRCTVGIESTVLNLTTTPPTLLRPGSITKEEIEEVLNQPIQVATSSNASPGMNHRHYSPNARIHLFETQQSLQAYQQAHPKAQALISIRPDLLYGIFRQADERGITDILILLTTELRSNAALLDRITRASQRSA